MILSLCPIGEFSIVYFKLNVIFRLCPLLNPDIKIPEKVDKTL
jgi:hypothetical protein